MTSLTALGRMAASPLLNTLKPSCTRICGAGYHVLTVPWRSVDHSTPPSGITSSPKLLPPTFLMPPAPLALIPVAGMKVMGKLRKRCKDCYFIMIDEVLHVMCETHPRHKQRQMLKKPKNTWIITHATQGQIRPW